MCGAPALDSSALRAHASTLPRGASLDGRARLYVVHHRGVTASLSPRATWVTSSLRSCHFVLRSFAAVASSVAASAGHSRLWPRSTQSETLMRALISASSTPWPEPRPFAIAVAFVLRDAPTCVCGVRMRTPKAPVTYACDQLQSKGIRARWRASLGRRYTPPQRRTMSAGQAGWTFAVWSAALYCPWATGAAGLPSGVFVFSHVALRVGAWQLTEAPCASGGLVGCATNSPGPQRRLSQYPDRGQ